jgi:hypothetical protein
MAPYMFSLAIHLQIYHTGRAWNAMLGREYTIHTNAMMETTLIIE